MITEQAMATEEEISAAVFYVPTIDAMYDGADERFEFLYEDYYRRQRAIPDLRP